MNSSTHLLIHPSTHTREPILHYHYPDFKSVVDWPELWFDLALARAISRTIFLLVGIGQLGLPGVRYVTFESPDVLPITFILVAEPPAHTFKGTLVRIK